MPDAKGGFCFNRCFLTHVRSLILQPLALSFCLAPVIFSENRNLDITRFVCEKTAALNDQKSALILRQIHEGSVSCYFLHRPIHIGPCFLRVDTMPASGSRSHLHELKSVH